MIITKFTPVPKYSMPMTNASALNLDAYHSIVNCPACNMTYRVLVHGKQYMCPCKIIYSKSNKGKKDGIS